MSAAARKRSLSKILKGGGIGDAFAGTLEGVKIVRDTIVRRPGANLSPQEAAREAARKEGFEIGRQEGAEVGRAAAFHSSKSEYDKLNAEHAAKFASALDSLLEQFEVEKNEWYSHAEERLADLAVEIARRALAKELEISRESVVSIAHDVLGEVTEGTKVRLRVNALDGSAIEARKRDLAAAFSNIKAIEVVEDRTIGFGCRLETDAGLMDARIEDYLARIVATAKEGK